LVARRQLQCLEIGAARGFEAMRLMLASAQQIKAVGSCQAGARDRRDGLARAGSASEQQRAGASEAEVVDGRAHHIAPAAAAAV
jgi:predicted lipid-binding transport protein (Tim44 family)